MAWVHFTDWLDPGQVPSRAQHQELYDAIRERYEAARGVELDMSPARDSRIPNARVGNDALDGSFGIVNIIWFLDNEVSRFYAVARDDLDTFGSDELLLQALSDLGLNSSITEDSFNPGGLPSSTLYNVARRMVQLCRYVMVRPTDGVATAGDPFSLSEEGSIQEGEILTEDGSWSSVVSDFIGDTPGVSGDTMISVQGRRDPFNNTSGIHCRFRSSISFALPVVPIYSSSMEVFMQASSVSDVAELASGTTIADSIVIGGDASVVTDITTDGIYAVVIDSGFTGTGLDVSAGFLSQTDSDTAMGYEPALPVGQDTTASKFVTFTICLTPAFAYPYEPITP